MVEDIQKVRQAEESSFKMKVPISDCRVIDLDAPTLPAYEARIAVPRCGSSGRKWHRHGAAEGHREAHCQDSRSPYWKTGYNLAYAGKWKERREGPE